MRLTKPPALRVASNGDTPAEDPPDYGKLLLLTLAAAGLLSLLHRAWLLSGR